MKCPVLKNFVENKIEPNLHMTFIISFLVIFSALSLFYNLKNLTPYPQKANTKIDLEQKAWNILLSYPDMNELLEVHGAGYADLSIPVLTIAPRNPQGDYKFRIFPNTYGAKFRGFGEINFKVSTKNNTVRPYFPEVEEYKKAEGTLEFTIPGTNSDLEVKKKYDINIEDNGKISIIGTDLAYLLYNCSGRMEKEWQFCRDLRNMFEQNEMKSLENERLNVSIRSVETNLDQEGWALDNISYQGMSIREWIERDGGDHLGEYIEIGDNTFYVIGEGCCGDNSTSYIYREPSGTRLIFFRERLSNKDELYDLLETL